MTIKLLFVRLAVVTQATFVGNVLATRCFNRFEIGTTGWLRGSRTRTKCLSFDHALRYADKLHSGGWIDAETHDRMWFTISYLFQNRHTLPDDDPLPPEMARELATITECVLGDWENLFKKRDSEGATSLNDVDATPSPDIGGS